MGNRRKIGTISAMAVLQLVAQTGGSIRQACCIFLAELNEFRNLGKRLER
jgi:hypothetical protein